MDKRFVVLVTAALVALSGCQTNMSREDWGKTLGTLGGAVLGAAVADEDKRWMGAAIGAAAGYFAGRAIGRYLSEQEREALAGQTVTALDEESAGSRTWQSSQSGTSAKIETGEIAYQSKRKEVQRLKSVQVIPTIRLENRDYQTTTALNVRGGPGRQYKVITTLKAGDRVSSAGRTDNGWLMLAKQGVTVGYVHSKYVEPLPEHAQAGDNKSDRGLQTESGRQDGFAGIDLDQVEIETATVDAQVGCRDVKISVMSSAGTETETMHACQKEDGVWELG
jgi:surface antigen